MANSSLMFAAPHLPCSHHLSVRQGWDLISLALVPFAFYPFLVSTSNFAVPDSCITETQQRARRSAVLARACYLVGGILWVYMHIAFVH